MTIEPVKEYAECTQPGTTWTPSEPYLEGACIYVVSFTPFWRRMYSLTERLHRWVSRCASATAKTELLRYNGSGAVSVNK